MSSRVFPSTRPPIDDLFIVVEDYFADKNNRPYTVAELLLLTGTDKETLVNWTKSEDVKERDLAWLIKYGVLAFAEKGDKSNGPPNTLVSLMVDRYFADEENIIAEDDRLIQVEVTDGTQI